MPVEIRKATTNDFEAVYGLLKAFAHFIQTPEKLLTTPEQMKEDAAFFQCYIAVEDGNIIGFATYFFAYYSWSGKAVYLDDLYVTEAHRGMGIGKQLLHTVIRTAKENNCRKIKWQVSKWNSKAIGFYKSLGATVDDVEINCELLF
jgi:GNAT superfamily N-acetyltransferase